MFFAKKNGELIYAPQSDGIGQIVFSPSGRFIAFVGSEIAWVDIKPGDDHSIVILDCESELLTGYINGFPMPDFKWETDRHFQYTNSATGELVKGKH